MSYLYTTNQKWENVSVFFLNIVTQHVFIHSWIWCLVFVNVGPCLSLTVCLPVNRGASMYILGGKSSYLDSQHVKAFEQLYRVHCWWVLSNSRNTYKWTYEIKEAQHHHRMFYISVGRRRCPKLYHTSNMRCSFFRTQLETVTLGQTLIWVLKPGRFVPLISSATKHTEPDESNQTTRIWHQQDRGFGHTNASINSCAHILMPPSVFVGTKVLYYPHSPHGASCRDCTTF